MQNIAVDVSNKYLLSIGEASEYLGVSIDTLRRWNKKGKIESYRSPGNHRYFKKQDLDGLFDRKYEREKEIKPRKTRERPIEEITKKPSFKAEEMTSITNLISDHEAVKILDREPKVVNIPPAQTIKIINRKRYSMTEIQDSKEQTITQGYEVSQQTESILTPPRLANNQVREEKSETIEDTHIQEPEIPQKDVNVKKQKITAKTIMIMLITLILLIAAVVSLILLLSPQKILSPIP